MALIGDILKTAFEQLEKPDMLGGDTVFSLNNPSTIFRGVFVDEDREVQMLQEGYSEEDFATVMATTGWFTTEPRWTGDQYIYWNRDGGLSTRYTVRSIQRVGLHYEFKLQRVKS